MEVIMKKIITGILLTCALSTQIQAGLDAETFKAGARSAYESLSIQIQAGVKAAYQSLSTQIQAGIDPEKLKSCAKEAYQLLKSAPQLTTNPDSGLIDFCQCYLQQTTQVVAQQVTDVVVEKTVDRSAEVAALMAQLAMTNAAKTEAQELLAQATEKLAQATSKQALTLADSVNKFTMPICQFAVKNPYCTIAAIALTGLLVKSGLDATTSLFTKGMVFVKRYTPETVKQNLPLSVGVVLGGLAMMTLLDNAQ